MDKRRHWTSIQCLNYYFFLILKYKQLERTKKSTKFFVEMSKFIHSKSKVQCRTHHQKKLLQMRKQGKQQKLEVCILRKFYHEYYSIRRLDQHYLKIEIQSNLMEKRNEGIIIQSQYQKYLTNLEENLKELLFEQIQKRSGLEIVNENQEDSQSNSNFMKGNRFIEGQEQSKEKYKSEKNQMNFDLSKSQNH